MGFWWRIGRHRRKQWVSPGFWSLQDLITRWRQQQAAAVTGVMVLPWKLFCPTPALPVPTAVVMETGVTADVELQRAPSQTASPLFPPSLSTHTSEARLERGVERVLPPLKPGAC